MSNVPIWNYASNSAAKINLVNEKFSTSLEFTNTFYALVRGYLNDLNSLVDRIPNINNSITIPFVDTETDTSDIEALLRSLPDNPLDGVVWPDPPTDTLVFDEDVNYSENLFNAFDEKLQSMLSDVTALINATIEDDILYRERERDLLVSQDAKTNKAAEWSERGFELPGGGLFTNIGQIDLEYQNTLLTKSRDIAVESRKIEIANAHKVLEEINKFEAIRMEFKSGYWQRKLEAAKSLMDRGTQIFVGKIEVIKAQSEAYKSVTTAYASHANALSEFAKARYDSVKGAIEYASMKVNARVAELNSQLRELEIKYNTSLGGVKAQADLAAQVMASALASVSTSVSMSTQDQVNLSNSTNASESWSHEG